MKYSFLQSQGIKFRPPACPPSHYSFFLPVKMVHLLGVVSLLLSSQLAFVAADEARFHKTKTNAVLLKLLARDSSHEARYDKDCSYGYRESWYKFEPPLY